MWRRRRRAERPFVRVAGCRRSGSAYRCRDGRAGRRNIAFRCGRRSARPSRRAAPRWVLAPAPRGAAVGEDGAGAGERTAPWPARAAARAAGELLVSPRPPRPPRPAPWPRPRPSYPASRAAPALRPGMPAAAAVRGPRRGACVAYHGTSMRYQMALSTPTPPPSSAGCPRLPATRSSGTSGTPRVPSDPRADHSTARIPYDACRSRRATPVPPLFPPRHGAGPAVRPRKAGGRARQNPMEIRGAGGALLVPRRRCAGGEQSARGGDPRDCDGQVEAESGAQPWRRPDAGVPLRRDQSHDHGFLRRVQQRARLHPEPSPAGQPQHQVQVPHRHQASLPERQPGLQADAPAQHGGREERAPVPRPAGPAARRRHLQARP